MPVPHWLFADREWQAAKQNGQAREYETTRHCRTSRPGAHFWFVLRMSHEWAQGRLDIRFSEQPCGQQYLAKFNELIPVASYEEAETSKTFPKWYEGVLRHKRLAMEAVLNERQPQQIHTKRPKGTCGDDSEAKRRHIQLSTPPHTLGRAAAA
eukprot:2438961-Prymnesium_polylepis.1